MDLKILLTIFQTNIQLYVKGSNIYLALKSVKHKLYDNLQSFPILIYQWKDLSINFVTRLPVFTNQKGEIYNSIIVIINWLIKIIIYELVKVIIDTLELANDSAINYDIAHSKAVYKY